MEELFPRTEQNERRVISNLGELGGEGGLGEPREAWDFLEGECLHYFHPLTCFLQGSTYNSHPRRTFNLECGFNKAGSLDDRLAIEPLCCKLD